ncbi:MAG: cytochrome P450 [Pseudonocardiaceae bacterium]
MASSIPALSSIPGPRGYPLVGVMPRLFRNPFEFMVEAARTHGGVVRLDLGPAKVYLVSHPDYVRHILVDNRSNYWKGPILRGLELIIGDGLFVSDGALWQRQRRLMSPVFHRHRLDALVGSMTDIITGHMARWQDSVARGKSVDLLEEMVPINVNILLRAIFGTSIGHEGILTMRRASNVIFHHSEKLVFSFFLPMSIPRPGHRRFTAALAVVNELVSKIITSRRHVTDAADLLSILFLARDEETGEGMSDGQIRDEVMSILMAGYESTAAAMAWTWYLLSQHPDVERELQAELSGVLDGRVPTVADLPNLRYTRMVIDETLRLYPPFPAFFRTSYEGDALGDYELPPGSAIIISPYATHRNPEYWERPEVFDPQRFGPERAAQRPSGTYYPFGIGQRLCIGSNLSLVEQQLTVATVAQSYRRELQPGYVLQPHYDIALRPRHGVPMILTPNHRS